MTPEIKLKIKGAFVWDQSGIRMVGIMQVSVRLGTAILIPEHPSPLFFPQGQTSRNIF